MDLLDYARANVARGSTSYSSHLQALTKIKVAEIKQPIKEQRDETGQENPKSLNTNIYLLISGLALLIASVLAIGYWLGKRKNPPGEEE